MSSQPAPYTLADPFPADVFHRRHPKLIERLLDAHPYGPAQRAALNALLDESLDGVITPLADPQWHAWDRGHFGQPWASAPFLWAESYFYRRLLDAVDYFSSGVDPFGPFKAAELTDVPSVEGEVTLETALLASLYGNQADLGFRLLTDSSADSRLVVDDTAAVVEFLDRILPGMDGEIAKQFQRLLEKQGLVFKLGSKVTGVDSSGATLKARIELAKGGVAETIEADVVLVAIGRVPYTEELGLDEAGVKEDNRGRVIVDAHFSTNVKGIYAIGDVIAGPMLAHKAEDEGMAVAEILAGQAGHVNYDVIPNVVYTFPEIASVGKTEEELKEAGIAYNTGKFPFTANGRAKANHQTDGFVKILADAKTDRVLGVHIVSSDAGNMIAEAAVAMEFGAAAEDIARTCHAHPTLPEAVKEAALAVAKRAIHM